MRRLRRGERATSRSSPTATAAGRSRGALAVNAGHEAGADTVKARLRDAAELGVRELTVYSFSTENWSRPKAEVAGLMRMFAARIRSETPELDREGVRMRFIGSRERVSRQALPRRWMAPKALTAANERITLYVAFNYGGRAEILEAAARYQGGGEEELCARCSTRRRCTTRT